MPNRSIRDVRQNASPMVRTPQPAPTRPAASPVMAQPMSHIARGAKPSVTPKASTDPVSQAGAGAVPTGAAIAQGMEAANAQAAQPRLPTPTVQGPVGPMPGRPPVVAQQ